MAFPNSTFDDQVDSMSQFLNWARKRRQEDAESDKMLAVLDGLSPNPRGIEMNMSAKQFYDSLSGHGSKNLGHMVPIPKFRRG